jgi:hypothetical protein
MAPNPVLYDQIDWQSKDRSYWKSLFKRAFAWGIQYPPDYNHGTHWVDKDRGQKVVDLIRMDRYLKKLQKPKHTMLDPVEDYGREIGIQVQRELDRAIRENGDPCTDNYRWARSGSNNEVRRFLKARDRGCCGSFNALRKIQGKYYWIGFNYGH